METQGIFRRKSKITIPDRCHPLAKMVFAEMARQRVTYDELEWTSGVLRSTFKAWRTHNRPGLESIEAALGALGWVVTVSPAEHTIPAELRADLQALVAKHGLSTLPALEYAAEYVGYSYPGCSLAERRRLNQQQNERLAA
jgi:hypothetical protein